MSRVYFGRLSHRAEKRDLEKLLREFGPVDEIKIKKGFFFAEFKDSRDAKDAILELNGKEFFGQKLIVEMARGTQRYGDRDRSPDRYSRRRDDSRDHYRRDDSGRRSSGRSGPPVRTDYRIIVKNLSSGVSWQDLKDYMRKAGEVTFADAHKIRRGEGIVEFSSSADMYNALDTLDNVELNGRRIELVKDSYRNSRSRRRSRSRSYSKSVSRSPRRSPRRSRHSRRRSPSRSRSVSRSRSFSRSRSATPTKDSRSQSPRNNKLRSRSRSATRSRSPSRSRSASPREKENSNRHTPKEGAESPKSPEKLQNGNKSDHE